MLKTWVVGLTAMVYRKAVKFIKIWPESGEAASGFRKKSLQVFAEKRGWGENGGEFKVKPRFAQSTPTGYTEGTQ